MVHSRSIYPAMTNVPRGFRNWFWFRPFQFTLRTLFVLTALASIWLGFKVNAVHRQQAAIAKLAKLEITVHYDHQHRALPSQELAVRGSVLANRNQLVTRPNSPRWLRNLIGDDYFQTATAVTLYGEESDIELALPHLKQLPNLR